jgi:hypothetical protein
MIRMCGTSFFNSGTPTSGWTMLPGVGNHGTFGFQGSLATQPYNTGGGNAGVYGIYYGVPVANPANQYQANPAGFTTPADVPFAGATPVSYDYQTYPSAVQFNSSPANSRWYLDFHAFNPGYGSYAGTAAGINFNYNQGILVAGTKTVYKFTANTTVPPYKVIQPLMTTGRHLIKDVGSATTGDIVTDSTPWTGCMALHAGECRAASAVGDVYMAVPGAGGSIGASNVGKCIANSAEEDNPCVIAAQFHAGAMVQGFIDTPNMVNNWRKITGGFTPPLQHWSYSSGVPDPTGQWAFFTGYWLNGIRSEMLAAKIPPFPSTATGTTTFTQLPVTVASSTYDQARATFGYAENGPSTNFYCTGRQEACVTSTSPTQANPFSYLTSDAPGWTSCAAGCTISVPAIPGRTIYYQIQQRNSGTSQQVSSATTAVAAP